MILSKHSAEKNRSFLWHLVGGTFSVFCNSQSGWILGRLGGPGGRTGGVADPLGLGSLYQLARKQFSVKIPASMGSNLSSATSQLGDLEQVTSPLHASVPPFVKQGSQQYLHIKGV